MTETVQRIADASRELNGFYAPAFEVRVDDERVPHGIVRDILSVVYRDSVDDVDAFDLTINNWDPARGAFKYLGGTNAADSPFEPGRKLTLHLGYQGHLQKMIVGEITSLSANFPQSGQPTLTVSGLNELHGFRGEPHTYRFQDQTDSAIARWLGAQRVTSGRPGLGFRVEAPNEHSEQEVDVQMVNEHDIVFLLRRARARGYILSVRQSDEGRFLYFGPPRPGAADQSTPQEIRYELAWGSGLLFFNPELTTANQVGSVTVRGFDRESGRTIEESYGLDQLRPRPNHDQHDVARAIGATREVIHLPLRSRAEARCIARDILFRNHCDMIKGSGETFGLPKLRAGQHLELTNLGARFSGTYLVLKTTHSIGAGGYSTSFEARREEPPAAAGNDARANETSTEAPPDDPAEPETGLGRALGTP